MELVWRVAKEAGPVAILLLAALVVVSGACGALGGTVAVLWRKLVATEAKLEASQAARIAELRTTLESERSRS